MLKSVVLKALQAADEGAEDLPLLASLAKAKAVQVASKACCEAIQMHGGIGMTDEHEIGFRSGCHVAGKQKRHISIVQSSNDSFIVEVGATGDRTAGLKN